MVFETTIEIKPAQPINLFYTLSGSEVEHTKQLSNIKPTLIWLHGGPGFDHSIHESFISTLAQNGIQVILIDLRGQGKSRDQDNPNNWNLAQWGGDVFDFCNTFRIKKPIVAGVSFGGVVAKAYMLKHTEQPAEIILCDTDSQNLTKLEWKFLKIALKMKSENKAQILNIEKNRIHTQTST